MRILRLLAALFAVLTFGASPAFADAQLLLTGVGGPRGGAAGYMPSGVMFSTALSGLTTNGAALTTSGGTVADTSHFTYFLEFRLSAGNSALWNQTTSASTNIASSEQLSSDGSESMPGIIPMLLDDSAGIYGNFRSNIGDSVAAAHPDQSHSCIMTPWNAIGFMDGNWHWLMFTGNLTSAGTTKDVVTYVDGTIEAQNCTYAAGGTMVANISGRGWALRDFVQGYNYGGRIELGDVFADLATDSICTDNSTPIVRNGVSYPCTVKDTVPAGLLAKFWSGGPVDLGSNGSTPLGRQPEIYYGHGAGPSTYQTNLGSVTNITTAGPLYHSYFAPGTAPVAHTAYVKWAKSDGFPGSNTSVPCETGGETITAGDRLICVISGLVASGAAPTLAGACPSGFTQDQSVPSTSSDSISLVVCDKVATGTEGTSIMSGSFTAFVRGVEAALIDVGQVASIRASAQVSPTGSSGSGSSSLASGTVSGVAGDTVLQIAASYNPVASSGARTAVITPDGGEVQLSNSIITDGGSKDPQITVTSELLASTGTTPVRTFNGTTGSGSGAAENDWAKIVTLDIQPN